MPRVVVTKGASAGLARCLRFLAAHDEAAARNAADAIEKRLQQLEARPAIGRPVPERSTYRELVISFGRTGYVALYEWDAPADAIRIIAFRHQRESGY